jgi:predicted DNA-binding transcriptional regulator YafY
MRADRLLSILMLLQSRQIMSAPDLARELGVSVRTIYRDVDALCAAGVPIYADMGANGGYRLVENYRTNLTGLTRDELNALLLVNIPDALASLDAGQKLKTALLKLYAAQRMRPTDETPRIYLDWAWWGQGRDTPPHLQTLYEAVSHTCRAAVRYRMINGMEIERVVEPYGLVAKAGAWYLVYAGNGRFNHHRVSALAAVRLLNETFERLAFDLESYWKAACANIERESGRFWVVLRITPAAYRDLSLFFDDIHWEVTNADDGGWVCLNVWFDSFYAARTAVLGLGGAVEIVEPEALRLSVADFAAQVVRVYTG